MAACAPLLADKNSPTAKLVRYELYLLKNLTIPDLLSGVNALNDFMNGLSTVPAAAATESACLAAARIASLFFDM